LPEEVWEKPSRWPGFAHRRKFPPDRNERSIEYDTVSDAYLHRLFDEIFPVVAKSVKMRSDGYSRAIRVWHSTLRSHGPGLFNGC